MRFLFLVALLLALLATVLERAQARGTTSVVCDIKDVATHRTGTTTATRLQVSSSSVPPGGSISISMSNANGGFGAFILYVTNNLNGGNAAHKGRFTGALPAGSTPCLQAPTGTTLSHNSATLRPTSTWTWTAPADAAPGDTLRVAAIVAESAVGVSTVLLTVTPVTITIAAAATPPPVATQAPTTQPPTLAPTRTPPPPPAPGTQNPPTNNPGPAEPTLAPPASDTPAPTVAPPAPPAPPASNTPIQQAYNMVLVRLQSLLNGIGSIPQLKTAIESLVKQIQTAIQATKAAQGMANANNPVNMIVAKAPATGVPPPVVDAAGGILTNLRIGFVNQGDAVLFAGLLTNPTGTTSGDLASKLQPDPNGLDQAGKLTVLAAQQVTLVTCPDQTLVSQDMVDILCPPVATAAAAPAGPTIPLSNIAFIGIIAGGVVGLLVLVGALVYYQKRSITKSTSVAPRV